jgi:L-fuconolactonase
VLQALQAASPNRFRGIRHTVTWDPNPEIENREKEGVLASADYRAGAQVLAREGLSLDIGVCFPQLPELAAFAKAVPDLTIILNHLGGAIAACARNPPVGSVSVPPIPPGEARVWFYRVYLPSDD